MGGRSDLSKIMPATQCTATSTQSGVRCLRWATRGAKVCHKHGAAAPQVRAAAQRRITLAEAVANSDRRHPVEVLDSALHVVDVAARQLLTRLSAGGEVTAEDITSLIETAKTQATMARVVLDTHRGDWAPWSTREAVRAQAGALANIVREVARILGHDPDSPQVESAMEQAVGIVVHGKPAPVRAHTVQAVEQRTAQDERIQDAEVIAELVAF